MSYTMDPETRNLVIQMHLEETQTMLKGKHSVGEPPDSELAAQLFKNELEALGRFYSDQAMCRSIAQAVVLDAELIRETISDEERVTHDREYAIALENGVPCVMGERHARESFQDTIDGDMLAKLVALNIGDDQALQTSDSIGSSSLFGRERTQDLADMRRRCIACVEDSVYTDTIRCACGHDYCRGCLAQLFELAIDDESLFPTRCCKQPISLGLNQVFLPAELVGRYHAKQVEYSTPNRSYCHERTCATFIPTQFIVEHKGTCVKCGRNTCTRCKGSFHESDCPPDAVAMDIMRLARSEGWMRCFSCRTLIELNTGCNHITCRCGAEFCYVCGEEWKTCDCEQWHEDRLLDRAKCDCGSGCG